MGSVAAEATVVCVSYLICVAYIVWNLAFQRDRNVASKAIAVRRRWAALLLSSKSEALLAVQTFRNFVMGASFLATTMVGAALLFLDFATDPQRVDQMNTTALSDPLTSRSNEEPARPVISAVLKLYIGVALSFFSFFFMTQNIRMMVHLGFFMRAAASSSDSQDQQFHMEFRVDTLMLLRRAGLFFLLGMRPFYLLIPTVAWLLGPSYLLAVSIILVLMLYFSDTIYIPGVRLPTYPGADSIVTDEEHDVNKV